METNSFLCGHASKWKLQVSLVTICLFMVVTSTHSEGFNLDEFENASAKSHESNFAVPESPAFELLGSEPSTILRPSGLKEFYLSVSEFVGSGQSVSLPKSFGIEFSPFLAARSSNLKLEDFERGSKYYHLKFSLATQRIDDATTSSRVALGVRYTFIDKSEKRTDPEFLEFSKQAHKLASDAQVLSGVVNQKFIDAKNRAEKRERLVIVLGLITKFKKDNPDNSEFDSLMDAIQSEVASDGILRDRNGQIDALWITFISTNTTKLTFYLPVVEAEVGKLTKEFEEEWDSRAWDEASWNKSVLDVAFAIRAVSPDSTAEKLEYDRIAGWLSKSSPISDWGQFILGANINHEKNTETETWRWIGSLDTRVYAGNNEFKSFVELQVAWKELHKAEWLLGFGAEMLMPGGFWAEFTAGAEYSVARGNTGLVTDLRVKTGL